MITEHDLLAAIAECQGERNPNANTCIKLAAYYTILDHVQEKTAPVVTERAVTPYSFAAEPARTETETRITYDSGTEFAQTISGMNAADAWSVMDELMNVLQATQPRLYNGVLRQLREK